MLRENTVPNLGCSAMVAHPGSIFIGNPDSGYPEFESRSALPLCYIRGILSIRSSLVQFAKEGLGEEL